MSDGGSKMNHIYKVVWSKVKNCYVVVSEIARNGGKEHSRHAKKMPGGVYILPLALALNFGLPSSSQAAVPADLGNGAAATYDAHGNLVIGNEGTVAEGSKRAGSNNTTIGTDSDTLRKVADGDTSGQPMDTKDNTKLVEGEGQAHDLDDYRSTEAGGSTAVGYDNHNEGDRSTAIGNHAIIANKPVTYYVDADGNKTASPDNAVWYKDTTSGKPTKVPQVFRDADGNTTTAPQYVHTYTEKDHTTGEDVTKTEITSDVTKADKDSAGNPVYNYKKEDNTDKLYSVTLYQAASNSIAAGTDVTANGSNAVAVGYGSTADNSAVAIGDTAAAKGNGVAIGKDTKATAEGSIALGKGSEANRDGGVAGWDPKTGTASTKSDVAWKSGEGALSIGNGGASRQITNVAAGSEDSDAVNLAQLKNAMTHYYSVKTTADTDAAGKNNYLNDGATGDNALAAGVNAKASGANATAVGYNTSASGSDAAAFGSGSKVTNGGVAVGSGATASGGGVAFGSTGVNASSGGLAVGMYGTNASSNSAAFGLNSTTATNSSVAVGANGTTAANSSFAAGFTSKAGTNGSSSSYGHNIAVGSNTTADNGSSAFGIDATANNQSLAIGLHGNSSSAYATNQSIAVGNGTDAFNFSTAIGNQAKAGNNGSYAVALGNEASALYDQTTAIGSGAKVISPYGTALGSGTSAAYYATALGNSASASAEYSTALGTSASTSDGNYATAVGNGAGAHGDKATALGYNASATSDYTTAVGDGAGAHGTSATALGNGASANSEYDTAIGSGAATGGGNGTALGYNAKAQSPYATALGSGASASYQAIALGYNAKSNVTGGVALGSSSTANVASGKTGLDPHTGAASTDTGTTWVSTLGAVSVGTVDSDGNATGTRQINGLAAGTKDTDAVNVAQLKALETRINMHYYSVNSTLSGDGSNYDNTGASGTNALAAGPMASATVENAVAIGYGAKAEGKGATVIGQYGEATGRYALAFGGQQTDTTAEQANNVASGDNAVSFGERTTASKANATAFGWQTTAKEKRATAFGERTTASGANSTAFGQSTVASGQNSTAFGNEAVANNYGSTAFGNRTEALGEYSTAFGNSTVAAGMNTAAFGTDNVAGAVLDDNGAYTNIIYQTNPKNGRVVKDKNGNPIETSREKMDARGNLAYLDGSGHTKSVTYTVPGGETHSYVLLQGTDGNTYIRDYRGNIRSATIGTDGTVTVGDTASAAVTLKQATAGANGYHILSNANATVWGENSIASGEASTAFGVGSIAAAKNSLAALGGTVSATATNAAAVGSGAQATLEDSVALGSHSVTTRAKYKDLTSDAEKAAYAKGTSTGSAWEATDNAIAVGNDSTVTRQITGVAAGSLDTDAVNVAQLKAVDARHTTASVGGQKATADNTVVKGGNLEMTRTTSNGQANYDVSLNKDIVLGQQEENKGGSIVVNSVGTFREYDNHGNQTDYPMKEAVKIDGTTVSVVKNDGSDGGNDQRQVVLGVGQDTGGYVALYDNTGKKPTYIFNAISPGITYLKDKATYPDDANEFGRLEYGDIYHGSTQFIATLDDGLKFSGDQGSLSTVKLNQELSVTGGVTDTNSLSTGSNIGVVSTPAVEDDQGNITQKAKLELKLNKDLTGLNTVTAGNAKIGSAPADTLKLTENGAVTETTAPAGSYVTGLDNKDWNTTNPSYVSGRAATEDQLAAVSGTINKGLGFTTNTQDATNTTDNYTGYKVVNRKLGDTIAIKAGDADPSRHYATTNLTTKIANNGDITIEMDESPTFTEVTASSFNLSPKDTTTKDKAGNTASAQLNAHYRDASLNPGKNVTMADGSTGMVRLHYHDGEGTIHDLATMDDGQIYAGDIQENGTLDTTGFGRKMNEKTTINGGVTDKDNLTDNNIGVVSNGTNTLTVKLAKNLKNLQSVQTGRTTMDDNGLTIKKSDDDSSKNVIVLGDKVAFGDNQVNHMGSGSDGTADGKPTYNTDTNGANIGDVKNIASSTVQPVIDTVNKGWELDVNGTKQKAVTPTSPKVNLIQGQNITITGDKDNTDNVTIATADDVRFNTVRVGGSKTGDTYSGGILIGSQSGKNADGTESANSNDGNYITGLENTNWDSTKIQHGRAATEDQLQAVATEIKNGTVKGDVFVTGGAVSYKGEGEGADPKAKDGTGSINLTRQNGTDVTIYGLHDYYVTGGTVTDDGKTLELTRNDVDGSGNPQKITVDLGNVAKNDLHLVANPDAGDGKYTVDATGTVTLKVHDPNSTDGSGYSKITIGGFEGLGKGLKFGANKMAKDGGGNPVTNQLGSTINVTGAGTKDLQDYSGKNLLTSVEQDADGNTTIHVLMDKNISADGVTVGQAGKDGADGLAGTIGINGKNGVEGEGGKEIITTTIIRTEKGQPGENGATGKPGVDGKDITRIVYQNDQDKVDGKDGNHTVATLDDGLKFSGDDESVITRKLNEKLQFVGGADKNKLTENNIGINEKDGKLTIQLVNTPNLGKDGNLTAGSAQIGWVAGATLDMTKDGTNPSGNKAGAGSYATGLSNKDWNVANPEYVSGRAATEDQLAKVSEAIGNATTAAGKRTVVTVNDKSNPAGATPNATAGVYGDYDSTGGNLMIAAKKDSEGVLTYNIKLNDQLAIGKNGTDGQDGKDGKDGKVTVETSKGTTVVIGHDGEPGKDGKDGISVKGQDGKDGVTISAVKGQNGSEGHIGLTGPKGADGKNADIDISTVLGKATLDRSQNEVQGDDKDGAKDQVSRIQYQTIVKEADGTSRTISHEVATMDDGLKIGANAAAKENAANPVSNKLNSTINIKGSDAKANHTYTDDNLTTTVEQDTDGNTTVKVLMDKDITGNSVIVGEKGESGAPGKDGVDGTIGVNGKDGSGVVIKGKDGISINGKDGLNGVTIKGVDGKDGTEGHIGLVGPKGPKGADGKDGQNASADIHVKNGQVGVDGTDGHGGKDSMDRVVYEDHNGVTHEVATMGDGLKFAGDDMSKTVDKKLNETLQIRGDGTYDKNNDTVAEDGNIKTSVDNGAVKVSLSDKINLHQDGSLTVGGDKKDGSTTVDDPIVIKHFDDKTLDMITGVDKDGKPISANKKAAAGDYVTGLDNKDWNVDSPTYVRGRAATEDQLKTISDAVKEASTTAGKHTVVTVEGGKAAGTTDYNGENLKLKVTDTAGQKTYDLKLSDKLNLGTVGKDGEKGTDGSVGLKGADGKSGIGLNGKDGISVIGIDGKNGVSITGSNGLNGKDGIDGKIAIGTPGKDGQPGKDAVSISGQNGEGHIGLTGPKGPKGADGKDGQNASADIHVKNGQVGVDGTDGHGGKDGMNRVVYEDHNGVTHEVATMDDGQKYAGDFGDGVSVKLNKTVNIKGAVNKDAKETDFVDGNIAVVANKNGEDGELLLKLNKDLTGLNSSSYATTTKVDGKDVTSKTVVDGTGLKIENGPSITNTGIDGGKHQITNVASGKDGKMYDTTVEGQENWNNAANIGDVTNIAKSAADGVQVKSGKNITVDDNNKVNLNDNITLGDDKDKTKQVSIDGNGAKITAGDGDNKVTVDGSKGQIVAGGDNGVKIGNIAGGDSSLTIYDKDGKATNQTDEAGKYVTNLGNKTWNKDGSYVSGRAATEDQLHQVESNVNKQITDVNTKIDKVDKHHTEVTVNGGTPAKADGAYTDGNLQLKQTTGEDGQKVYDLKLNDHLKVGQKGDAGKAGKDGNVTVETTGGTTVVIGHDGKDGKDGRDGLFVTGKDGKNGKSGVSITGPNGVAGRDGVDGKVGIAGKDGRDAVSIAGRDGVGHIGLTGPKGADGKDGAFTDLSTILGQATLDPAKNVKGKDGDAKDEKASRIHYETTVATKDGEKTVSHEVATMDDGMKYSGDSGSVAVKLNNNVQLYGGAKEYAAGDNIGVVVSQDGDNAKMQVKLAKDLKGIDSIDAKTVTTGNTTINNGGLTVKGDDKHKDITVQQGAVNMGGNKIEGVAPGRVAPDSMDAVNGSQLAQRDQAIGKLGGEVNNLDRRVDRVGAGAAALAALHPQDFDPDDKWDFAVGYGNYRGANAAAVGAFYRPNEDTTLSVGGTVGGGENMVNAGISFKFGQGNHVTNSRVAMAKEILALKDYVQKQDEKIEKLEALVGQQGTANAPKRRSILFPDVPENHWAYVYVKKLADRGLLEGYPDGEFKGTRTITRYEFAAIFSRALENGASVDGDMERMSEEFEPEIRELSLSRFRVDRVEGDDNDRHKIERVRVNDRDELVKQKNGEQKKRYRDVYGSVIEKDAPADAAK